MLPYFLVSYIGILSYNIIHNYSNRLFAKLIGNVSDSETAWKNRSSTSNCLNILIFHCVYVCVQKCHPKSFLSKERIA